MRKTVVTIGRQYGSGGRTIARALAENLGIPFYDKELIAMAAEDTGFSREFVQAAEQKKTSSLLYSLYFSSENMPTGDQVFIAQCRVIKRLAQEGPCVIVGRCADYVLRELPGSLHVFVHAPLEDRVRRAREEYGLKEDNAKAVVHRQDKNRGGYYSHFTAQRWGEMANYDLMINSSLGLDLVARTLADLVRGVEADA